MKVTTINSGYFKLDGGAMHGVVPKSMWNKVNVADENNMCTWAMRCMLVEVDKYKILIDCGIGNKQDDKFLSRYYLHGNDSLENSLAKSNCAFSDITDVFLTHLHFDHCGGAVRYNHQNELVPTFFNARYWSDRLHWKYALNPNEREAASFLKENIKPLEDTGNLHFVHCHDGGVWAHGIEIRFVQGHTESMMLPIIPYKNTKILYCADLIPSAAHVSIPWVMAYDMKPLSTLNEKKEILNIAANNNWVLFFEHDPLIECATLQHTDKGIRIKDTFKLTEIDKFIL